MREERWREKMKNNVKKRRIRQQIVNILIYPTLRGLHRY
jgi:hypothetical protein